MKLSYLFYLSVFAVLFFAGCKKNNSRQNSGKTTANNGSKSTPALPTAPAQLLSFKINGAPCAYDSLSVSYYYPVAVGASLTGFTVNYDNSSATTIYINDVPVK
ncbi:MAG TPA: hypothetical protein VNW51_00745, partial [Mucilaginibacter sp.]|nr:hypothetical protein [Mucilaginibacter sp.]